MRKKIGILLENRFIDREIAFYQKYFPAQGFELHFLTRLWGQGSLTFHGMDQNTPIAVNESLVAVSKEDLKSYAAIIVPAGYVADFLLYSNRPKEKSPAVLFLETVLKDNHIVKGFICHALWIVGPLKEIMEDREVTCHNNIISHVENAGMVYVDKTVHVDEDIVTARTGGDYEAFASQIVQRIQEMQE